MTAKTHPLRAGRSARRRHHAPSTTPASCWTTTSPSTATSSTARSAPRCAASPGSPPSSRTSPRSSTASCASSASCSPPSGARAPPTTPRTRMRELAALAETAGSEVLAGVVQRRSNPDPATYLGKGKAVELRDIVIAEGADTVICDTELAPSQRRALEDVVKVKVIDRTALILDIFAQHAKSREGKAQVELAQLQYLLPRLRGWGESMSRQAGGQAAGGQGMGSRGPGETKIELDRRRINTRIAKLRREIKEMKTVRDTKRGSRRANAVPSVAIAGYTNAGKSSHPQPPHRRRRARREPALRDPRPHRAPRRDPGRAALHARRHRRVRARAAAPARRGVPLHARGGRRGRPAAARRRRLAPRPRGPDLRGAHRARRRRRHRRQARSSSSTRPTSPTPRSSTGCAATRSTRSSCPPAPARASTSCARSSPTSCPSPTSRSTCSCPTTAATSSAASTSRARCSSAARGRRHPVRARVHADLAADLAAFGA